MASPLLSARRPSSAHRCGEFLQHGDGPLPADAGVGDRLAVDELLRVLEVLPAIGDERLDHDPDDAALALRDLGGDLAGDGGLPQIVLAAVAMARVDQQALRDTRVAECGERLAHAVAIMVRP